ncbi:hypothetical protein EV361DRAFT_265832 [Lentinula raphanica]|uniref:Uncharacterized protein n=1 Tax=Lentinula raphanica TaxID=153919 RepID=A0AA38PCE1_9AGAR|nr:hypothetical protein F5880DRAFT_1215142 [Lentinula raphanica]KAJ3840323.1 hypothetical protein F5878DRAFT_613508 [Lentinula raphanica]KAJ3970715.1 hypothetical protein EV361DRAFT_265832 [Lentinula raphanica]
MSKSLSQPKAYFISLFCEAIFAGLNTFLFCAAMYLLLQRRKKHPRGPKNAMIAMTIIMYCLSMLHLAFSLEINLVALFDQKASAPTGDVPKSAENTENVFACTPIAAETLNCLLGDCIVIWRTWTLWNRSWKVILIPCALLLGGIVAGGLFVHAIFVSLVGTSLFNQQTIGAMIAFGLLTSMVNFYAILAIGYRAWTHSRYMKVFSSSGSHVIGTQYLTIFLIFVESGFIYCTVPVLMVILFSASNNGVYIVIGILAQMTGIYPTAIMVLVCLQLTQHDHITQAEFASTSGSTQMHRLNYDSQPEYTLTIPESVISSSSGTVNHPPYPIINIQAVKSDTDGSQRSTGIQVDKPRAV